MRARRHLGTWSQALLAVASAWALAGCQGFDGWTGPAGPPGAMGKPGDGTTCWDLDNNGQCGPREDVDDSGTCDIHDCPGPAGPTGPAGPAGPAGPHGADGPSPVGAEGPAGAVGQVLEGDSSTLDREIRVHPHVHPARDAAVAPRERHPAGTILGPVPFRRDRDRAAPK